MMEKGLLNSSQRNLIKHKKKAIYLECLAIKEAIKYWQHWLIGKYFEIYSDHKPLENMNIKARTDEELGDLTHYYLNTILKLYTSQGKIIQKLKGDCLSRTA